ncbi:MAG TPA: hypothetical protein VGJ20_05990 [Xanthobacteraceae bacterium]|jgi:hypothetical protein
MVFSIFSYSPFWDSGWFVTVVGGVLIRALLGLRTADKLFAIPGDWAQLNRHQLRIEPLCRLCLERGHLRPATVARLGEVRSLCVECHDSLDRTSAPRRSPVGWPSALKAKLASAGDAIVGFLLSWPVIAGIFFILTRA